MKRLNKNSLATERYPSTLRAIPLNRSARISQEGTYKIPTDHDSPLWHNHFLFSGERPDTSGFDYFEPHSWRYCAFQFVLDHTSLSNVASAATAAVITRLRRPPPLARMSSIERNVCINNRYIKYLFSSSNHLENDEPQRQQQHLYSTTL